MLATGRRILKRSTAQLLYIHVLSSTWSYYAQSMDQPLGDYTGYLDSWFRRELQLLIPPRVRANWSRLGYDIKLDNGVSHPTVPPARVLAIVCAHCNRTFKTQRGCKQHTDRYCLVNHRSNKRLRTCGWCHLLLPTVGGCIQHMKRWCNHNPMSNRMLYGTSK